jgi:hypothetical protein
MYGETYDLSGQFEAAVGEGDPDAAGLIIDFWGKAGTFAAMAESGWRYWRETAPANVLD